MTMTAGKALHKQALHKQALHTPGPVMLHAVSKRFGRGSGAVKALDGLSLSFPAGSFTVVLGVWQVDAAAVRRGP
jgi:hypothetical protein